MHQVKTLQNQLTAHQSKQDVNKSTMMELQLQSEGAIQEVLQSGKSAQQLTDCQHEQLQQQERIKQSSVEQSRPLQLQLQDAEDSEKSAIIIGCVSSMPEVLELKQLVDEQKQKAASAQQQVGLRQLIPLCLSSYLRVDTISERTAAVSRKICGFIGTAASTMS